MTTDKQVKRLMAIVLIVIAIIIFFAVKSQI